jgi:fermentation-respiration switch protein FrsA (DUF1100 family)
MSDVHVTDQYTFEVLPGVTRQSVLYSNRYGIDISADLYLPRDFDPTKYPASWSDRLMVA